MAVNQHRITGRGAMDSYDRHSGNVPSSDEFDNDFSEEPKCARCRQWCNCLCCPCRMYVLLCKWLWGSHRGCFFFVMFITLLVIVSSIYSLECWYVPLYSFNFVGDMVHLFLFHAMCVFSSFFSDAIGSSQNDVCKPAAKMFLC